MSAPCPLTCTHPHTAKILLDAHNCLLASGTYLADPDVRAKVEWIQDGKVHKLVTKNMSVDSGVADSDNKSAPTSPKMAILSVIVVVSGEDFWMMPDAGWRGATKVSKSLADVKPSCTVERPLLEILSEDFDAAIGNLKWLQDQTATHGFHVKKGLLVGHPGLPRIKIRHVLFEVTICLLSLLCDHISNEMICN